MTTRRDLAWTAATLLALLAWEAAGLDLALAHRYGGEAGFALREHWLASGVLHRGGYWLSALLVATVLPSCIGPWRSRRLNAGQRGRWLAALALGLLLVPALKRASLTSCPWSLAEFGGNALHVSHWAFGVADGGPGHCFPSGHASGAFALVAGYFAWRQARPRVARAWLLGSLTLGALYGIAQVLRGAHYPSHVLWSAWLCWAVALSVHRLPWPLARGHRRAPASPNPGL